MTKNQLKCWLSVLAVVWCMGASALSKAPVYLFYIAGPQVVELSAPPKMNPAGDITLTAPAEGAVVPLLSEGQKAYTMMPREPRVKYFADEAKRKEMQALGFRPLSVTLEWTCGLAEVEQFTVVISENKNFSDAVAVNAGKENKLVLNNLKIAYGYYWKVVAETKNGKFDSPAASFFTEDHAPRLLGLSGVGNFRDLGGRKGWQGKRVRQGMIYRTAGLNSNASNPKPTEKALAEHPEYKVYQNELNKRIARNKADLASKAEAKYLPLETIGKQWNVYVPEGQATLEQCDAVLNLTEAPEEFLGAKGQKRRVNKEESSIPIENPAEGRVAVFMQTFNAKEDGYVQVGCAADWKWFMSVNGVKVIDRTREGNQHSRARTRNNTVDIPVKAGKNTIAVAAVSDKTRFSMCLGAAEKKLSHEEVLKAQIRYDEHLSRHLNDGIETFQVPGKNRLTDITAPYLTKTLDIKSDIDLRSDRECYGMTGSPMGDTVTWFHYSSSAYDGMGGESGKAAFRKVFTVFLDEKNYPVDFHCIAGQDRTGAVACILNGLLGVEEEQLYLDWEVTGFWNPAASFNHERLFNKLIKVFTALPGDSLNQQIEHYVLSLGFTAEDIAKFRKLMLEEDRMIKRK